MKQEIAELVKKGPRPIPPEYRFDAFDNGETVCGKKKGKLPPMGWNSWNAFGTNNNEALTREMADALVRLGLDKLGYRYVVLDDGCYENSRVDGRLAANAERFPSGFPAMASYIHGRGLKFGMYNDVGSNLCSGAYVGTCGHEDVDAKSYAEWDIDFLKVDNCYYLWDNATFSNGKNARYVYAPAIRSVRIAGEGFSQEFSAADGVLLGERAAIRNGCVTDIGTFDGTGPAASPVGDRSGEFALEVTVPSAGTYTMSLEYATAKEEGQGSWLQVAVGFGPDAVVFDGFVPETPGSTVFRRTDIAVPLAAGCNTVRLMNHRRQENTLCSYATLLSEINKAMPGHDIFLSLCEWGKTQPQNWGYKVGDSWRILNDITFRVGRDGDPGYGAWKDDYTPSVTSQYNKTVIMDGFAGLDRGWNDPDMLMIGMNGLSETQCRTHMTMWCMLNAPLMLGLDLRRVEAGDWIFNIIADRDLIALNQDPLGVQAKRVSSTITHENESCRIMENVDRTYLTDINRVDILVKPLADGSAAVSFINVSEKTMDGGYSVSAAEILDAVGDRLPNRAEWESAKSFSCRDILTGAERTQDMPALLAVSELAPCDNVTLLVKPVQ
ncbi:MAG: alpha-galactosidase [Lachnospiraceae bacterium]|nr:alpha-galactosidase [Lachnospiraceae bacterium]